MTVGTSLEDIQVAIQAKLTGDIELMALVSGVFDAAGIPDNPELKPAFPYISHGAMLEQSENAYSTPGYLTTYQVDIWTKYAGFKQCWTIFKEVQRLLSETAPDHGFLDLSNMQHAYTNQLNAQPLHDPDDTKIRRLNVEYEIFAQEL